VHTIPSNSPYLRWAHVLHDFIYMYILSLALYIRAATVEHEYDVGLSNSILFYEVQRSRKLPRNQRVS